ncbi:MAG TPA: DUF6377 domain-containing protein, partial [Cytophagaceae bacterium]
MSKTLLCLLPFLFSFTSYPGAPLEGLLINLDHTIDKKEEYLKSKNERIANIKEQLVQGSDRNSLLVRYKILDQLFEEYKTFHYDSAFNYGRELLQTAYLLKEDSIINAAKVKMGFTLLSAGMFKEALDTLNSIDVSSLNTIFKVEYYATLGRTYYDLADYSNDRYFSQRYDEKGNECIQKALSFSLPNSIKYLLLQGLAYMRIRDTAKAITTFETVLKQPGLSRQDSAIACSSLSYMYRLVNDPIKAKEHLAKAAINDIISCTRETVAIRDLAEVLYHEGDVNRSYKYVKVALEDAYFYGANYRKMQITNVLPIIEGTQLEIVEGQRRDLYYYAIIVTILAVFIIVFSGIIFRQYKKLHIAKHELIQSHKYLEQTN